jgi:1,4-alpha-glucan branching enzyme
MREFWYRHRERTAFETGEEVVLMDSKKALSKSKKETPSLVKKVQFSFTAPEAQQVCLAGDFNGWDTGATLMKKDKKGVWKKALSLAVGRHEYRFIVDGKWLNDPSCSCCVQNEFGSMNCVVEVEE